jgi:hypothetical protein
MTNCLPLFTSRTRFTDDSALAVAVGDALLHECDCVVAFHEYVEAYPNARTVVTECLTSVSAQLQAIIDRLHDQLFPETNATRIVLSQGYSLFASRFSS